MRSIDAEVRRLPVIQPGPMTIRGPVDRSPGDPARCGTCTMCCRLTAVPELRKPLGQWCEYCDKGKGCRIWHVRPQSCRTYECLWYVNKTMPPDLRPDRSKVVFERLGRFPVFLALVNHGCAYAIARPKVGAVIRQLLGLGFSVAISIDSGRQKRILPAPGTSEPTVWQMINQFATEAGANGGPIVHD